MVLKGQLIVIDSGGGDAKTIEFMFNPQEINFTRQSQWQSDVGVRTTGSTGNGANEEGPKVNFGGVQAYTFSLNKLIFDTYETKESVLDKYINNIKKGVATPKGLKTRPPVYVLTWGDYDYFPCVMTSLSYTLTMFMKDGTPVRALVDISLLEVDKGALSKKSKEEYGEITDDLEDKREDKNENRAKENIKAQRDREREEQQRIQRDREREEQQRIQRDREREEQQRIQRDREIQRQQNNQK
jgi:hypothetical protein